jgi:aminopeptidase
VRAPKKVGETRGFIVHEQRDACTFHRVMAFLASEGAAIAAAMLVKTALHLREGDRFVIICDAESNGLADVVRLEAESLGVQVTFARLDQLRSVSTNHSGERPHKVLPDLVRRAMLAAQGSVFMASAPHQELSMREQLQHIVGACKVRHAHMPGVTLRAFAAGMKTDCGSLETWGRAVERKVELARTLEATSPAGTDLRLTFPASNRWTPHLGTIAPGNMSILPAGALFAQPESADGVFVANASVSDFFGAREGLLTEKPVTFHIEGGRVVRVLAPAAPELQRDLEGMIAVAPNSNRVGLAMLGVNADLAPTGDSAVDENVPGLHLVIGDTAGRIRTSTWSARTSFAACAVGGSVEVDGVPVIENGKLSPS